MRDYRILSLGDFSGAQYAWRMSKIHLTVFLSQGKGWLSPWHFCESMTVKDHLALLCLCSQITHVAHVASRLFIFFSTNVCSKCRMRCDLSDFFTAGSQIHWPRGSHCQCSEKNWQLSFISGPWINVPWKSDKICRRSAFKTEIIGML